MSFWHLSIALRCLVSFSAFKHCAASCLLGMWLLRNLCSTPPFLWNFFFGMWSALDLATEGESLLSWPLVFRQCFVAIPYRLLVELLDLSLRSQFVGMRAYFVTASSQNGDGSNGNDSYALADLYCIVKNAL